MSGKAEPFALLDTIKKTIDEWNATVHTQNPLQTRHTASFLRQCFITAALVTAALVNQF
jgi:hypothetical protein